MSLKPEYHTLANGIRLVHMAVQSPVAHLGLFINTGTRDEPGGKDGLAHFIEHMIFKGTRKRKAYHVLNRLESVGGELNAFTTKEYTCLHTSFLHTWYPRASELLSDIILNSVFPDKEIVKEKDIVIEEINSYKDTPSELIYDEFESALYREHPMGRPILGEPDKVRGFSRDDILGFYRDQYIPGKMVICSVGAIGFPKLITYLDRDFGSAARRPSPPMRIAAASYAPFREKQARKTYQSHSILGNRAYPRGDSRRFAFGLLNNILGGPGMNSRLNMNVREKHGLAYSVDSFYFPYSDTGVWGIYLGTDNGSADRAMSQVMKELKKIRQVRLGSLQLSQAKKQYRGQIAIAFDSNVNVMLSGGRGFLYDQKLLSVEDIFQQIEKVTDTELLEIANDIFQPDMISTLTYTAAWNS
jgi:predicted Zn-dependent peptidase